MKKILIKLFVSLMRFINLFLRPCNLKERVVFISRQSDEPSLDIRLLNERLKDSGVETLILCQTLNKSIKGIAIYAFHLLAQMKALATSKVVVLDGYCILASILPKKNGQTIIQMWHALGAVKKFGWQSVDNPDGHSKDVAELMEMHRNYDYVLAPSTVTGMHFAEAFRTSSDRLVFIGLPRLDIIRKCDDKAEELRKAIISVYPKASEKTNVLYVPTFRKNQALCLENLVNGFNYDKFNLIIKKHFLDKGDYSWAIEQGAIVDERFSSMDWLRISPKVITDYSAMAFEAAAINRELYIFQPDLETYEGNVGRNILMEQESIAEYVADDEETLFKALEKEYNPAAIESFKEKYLEINMSDCTGQLCSFIRSCM